MISLYENSDEKIEHIEEGDLMVKITNHSQRLRIFILIQNNNLWVFSLVFSYIYDVTHLNSGKLEFLFKVKIR